MNPNHILNLREVIAATLAEEPHETPFLRQGLDQSIGLAVIKWAKLRRTGEYGEEFLQGGNAHSKTVGILGMNHIGHAIVRQARLGFGMKVLYHDWQPVPEVEAAHEARLFPADDVLRQADLVCVVLPLIGEVERLICRHVSAVTSTQTICIAWRRSLPIDQAITYLGRYYTRRIHLNDLAAAAGLSKFRFARLFSATLGITPHRYQLLLRVSHAKTMLCQGVGPAEVAYRLGFSDQSHFGRCFQRITGMTPGQYRKGGSV